jgi:hypothetical protein
MVNETPHATAASEMLEPGWLSRTAIYRGLRVASVGSQIGQGSMTTGAQLQDVSTCSLGAILGAGQVGPLFWSGSIPKRGATMPSVDPETLRKVEQAFLLYTDEVEQSNQAADTKWTYLRHARTLVRWLADDFEPGERAR